MNIHYDIQKEDGCRRTEIEKRLEDALEEKWQNAGEEICADQMKADNIDQVSKDMVESDKNNEVTNEKSAESNIPSIEEAINTSDDTVFQQ